MGGEGRNNKRSLSSANNRSLDQQSEHVKHLEVANRKLETELILMKDALQKQQEVQFKDNVDHFVRIQELFNKVQIENKQLHAKNKKLETLMSSHTYLVSHLEQKVTSVTLEKEEIIVKLKSDIVLLRSQIEESERNFVQRVQEDCAKFEQAYTADFKVLEKKLRDEKDHVLREKADMQTKINQLGKEQE